ncbi:MAG: cell wall biosynthesis glycosyltransferase, partial [Rothia mucilaginosa]|nr:cell wall biosynthesis glycosyltransferase [Rothia mucilaginosa]
MCADRRRLMRAPHERGTMYATTPEREQLV